MNFYDLIVDVKIYIASLDEEVWINMVFYDEKFKEYAFTKEGLKQFVDHFHQVIINRTYLFGKLHSINDLPAKVNDEGVKHWYYNGKRHRENDLAAIIHVNGYQEWWYDGVRHRENDLPAFINNIYSYKEWWYEGFKHRENDLPAIIHNNGRKEWWYHGKNHRTNHLPR